VAAVGLVALLAADASRRPQQQLTARAAIVVIHAYQQTVSPLLSRVGVRCRLVPTCSRYAEDVIGRHGIVTGGWRAVRRVLRCGPWTPAGTLDPPE